MTAARRTRRRNRLAELALQGTPVQLLGRIPDGPVTDEVLVGDVEYVTGWPVTRREPGHLADGRLLRSQLRTWAGTKAAAEWTPEAEPRYERRLRAGAQERSTRGGGQARELRRQALREAAVAGRKPLRKVIPDGPTEDPELLADVEYVTGRPVHPPVLGERLRRYLLDWAAVETDTRAHERAEYGRTADRCEGKICYPTREAAALKAAVIVSKQHRTAYLRTYFHDACGKYHITSRAWRARFGQTA